MARVGVGVPVRNGGELLRESLECLRTQSFENIEVVIGDNASDDRTADICAEFAARDSRFRHIRRAENLGSSGNFSDLLGGADAELFMWRAYDDLSDSDYIERLISILDGDAGRDLAVGSPRSYPFRPLRPGRASSASCTSFSRAMRAGSTASGAARRWLPCEAASWPPTTIPGAATT